MDETFWSPEFNTIYRTNVNGYRIANDVPAFTKSDKCDILFIGDSFTQGAQVDYSEMFSTLVEDSLPKCKVVNAGISGAGVVDELCYFVDEGQYLRPKLVVLQIGVFNDFMEVHERHADFRSLATEKSSLFRFISYNITGEDECPLGRWTEPIFPDELTNENLDILYKKSSPQKEQDKSNLQKCLTCFKKECDNIHASLLVVLIPSKVYNLI